MKKKIVYICSALKGNKEENMEKAAVYSRKAMEMGYIPYTPHLMFTHFINEDIASEREEALQMGLEMLPYCQELWVFGKKITSGMAAEVLKARILGIPVYYKNLNILEKRTTNKKQQQKAA